MDKEKIIEDALYISASQFQRDINLVRITNPYEETFIWFNRLVRNLKLSREMVGRIFVEIGIDETRGIFNNARYTTEVYRAPFYDSPQAIPFNDYLISYVGWKLLLTHQIGYLLFNLTTGNLIWKSTNLNAIFGNSINSSLSNHALT